VTVDAEVRGPEQLRRQLPTAVDGLPSSLDVGSLAHALFA